MKEAENEDGEGKRKVEALWVSFKHLKIVNIKDYSPFHVTFSVKNPKKSETYPYPGNLREPT